MVRICRYVLASLATLIILASPASASNEHLMLSSDGSNWARTLAVPVFDPAVRWVPGDVRRGDFFVRNDATDPGALTLVATIDDPDGLVEIGDIGLSVRRDGGPWEPLSLQGPGATFADVPLAPSAQTHVEVIATFLAASTNRSQRSAVHLAFAVRMSQIAVAGPTDSGQQPGSGQLPNTGGVAEAVLWLGIGLTAFGLGTLTAHRHNDWKDRHGTAR